MPFLQRLLLSCHVYRVNLLLFLAFTAAISLGLFCNCYCICYCVHCCVYRFHLRCVYHYAFTTAFSFCSLHYFYSVCCCPVCYLHLGCFAIAIATVFTPQFLVRLLLSRDLNWKNKPNHKNHKPGTWSILNLAQQPVKMRATGVAGTSG